MLSEMQLLAVATLAALPKSLSRFLLSTEGRLILVTVVAVAIAWTALLFWDRRRKQLAAVALSPQGLFDELCNAHQFSLEEREALRGVIAARQLTQPAAIFVDPRHLRDAVDRAGAASGPLMRMQLRVFGDSLEA